MIRFCNLFSGSSGNCTYISSGTTNILVDAGVSCQKITKALAELNLSLIDIDGIIITHEHIDHTKGLTTISKKYSIPIYASVKTWKAMEPLDVPGYNRQFFSVNEEFILGDFKVFPFTIPHDAVDPCGFNIFSCNKKITVATDMGHLEDSTLKCMEDSDILLLESNYDKETLKCSSYPFFLKQRIEGNYGHLSNDMATEAICKLSKRGVNNIILGHLSKENNFPELAYQTVLNGLASNNCMSDLHLSVASRDKIDEVMELA